jgi:hypothetical protein
VVVRGITDIIMAASDLPINRLQVLIDKPNRKE